MNLQKHTTCVLMLFVILCVSAVSNAQERTVFGAVFEEIDGEKTPMMGAVIKVPNSGIGTQSDVDGTYRISVPSSSKQVIFERAGYVSDTFQLKDGTNNIAVTLVSIKKLDEVNITYRKKGNEIGLMGTRKTELISERELFKAACCNLSESFETTPSIDVSFTDAVSGYKQIQMLGLSGPYTLITRENIPDVRGLSAITGLTFTPGTWIAGMQLSKGTGSVVNGYESVAGQLNIELRKPFNDEKEPKAYINLYQNLQGRSEGNLILRKKLNDGVSTSLMLHGGGRWRRMDMNNDGFMDQPQNQTFIGLNRWQFFGTKGWGGQVGVKGVYVDKYGGQLDYNKGIEQVAGNPWGFSMNTRRIEGWAKAGKVFQNKKNTSMGFQLSAVHHEQGALYGKRNYDATQNTLYANWIYQGILGTTDHVIKAGLSSMIDNYNETFEQDTYTRNEVVPGAFVEYAYSLSTKFNVVAGLRGDYHNLYGAFVTPRIHVRYAPYELTAIRASFGRAQRTANIFAENIGYIATARNFIIEGNDASLPYGLDAEVALNGGINLTQKFTLNYRDGSFSADYYHTDFRNQIIVDVEKAGEVRFYNLDGPSVANSLQGQFDYEPIRNFDVRLAYRWYDVKVTYKGVLKQRPFVANHRAFINMGYKTKNDWSLDYTVQWISSKRVPLLYDEAINTTVVDGNSPSFIQMSAQISKSWNDENFQVYVGGENLTNYLQTRPILGASNPFSNGFDASMVWGPVMGRNIYAGLRWKIK